MKEESVFLSVIKILLLILFPPIGVFFYVEFGMQFWINLLLTLFGYLPGLVHAIYIASHPSMHKR